MSKKNKMIPVAGVKPDVVHHWDIGNLPKTPIEEEQKPHWRDRVREIVTPIWFDYRGTHFFDGDGKMIAQIRGWGGLTSSGLTDEEARAIQEKNAGYIVNAVNEHETLTAKIEALEAKLAAAERLINEINDARAANWHLQRRRENDQFEWFSSTADSVFGPFPTALEAFAAVRQENTDA